MTELGYDPQGRPVYETTERTCRDCGVTKRETEFRLVRGYRLRSCRSCHSRRRREDERREAERDISGAIERIGTEVRR